MADTSPKSITGLRTTFTTNVTPFARPSGDNHKAHTTPAFTPSSNRDQNHPPWRPVMKWLHPDAK